MQRLMPYRTYRDSGVGWLGQVPDHWGTRKLRSLLRRATSRNRPDLPLLSVVREKGVILRDTTSADENHNCIPDDLSNYKVVRAGQFAMNKMKAWQGSYGVSQHDGIVSPAYFVFQLVGVESQFFHRAIRSQAYVPSFSQASDGVRIGQWDLAEARMRDISFIVPSLSEQSAIVRYLDYKDWRIQRYIRAKQKLIKLLEEQKQAIIHQAVTGRIDVRTGKPYPAYKPSGVEWLGDVPEHWEVMPLSRVSVSRCDGPFGSGLKSVHYTDDGIRVVRLQNIGFASFNDTDTAYISCEHYKTLGDHDIEAEDIIIAGLGDENHPAGRACVAPESILPAMVKADCFRFRLRRESLDPAFAAMLLSSTATDSAALLSTGATRQRINLQSMGSRRIVVPPLGEQMEIVRFAGESTALLVNLIARFHSQIHLLREYRTRLISDVVTGKLDVREAAANLPDELEEEPEEDQKQEDEAGEDFENEQQSESEDGVEG